jgi:hypothetical protein
MSAPRVATSTSRVQGRMFMPFPGRPPPSGETLWRRRASALLLPRRVFGPGSTAPRPGARGLRRIDHDELKGLDDCRADRRITAAPTRECTTASRTCAALAALQRAPASGAQTGRRKRTCGFCDAFDQRRDVGHAGAHSRDSTPLQRMQTYAWSGTPTASATAVRRTRYSGPAPRARPACASGEKRSAQG